MNFSTQSMNCFNYLNLRKNANLEEFNNIIPIYNHYVEIDRLKLTIYLFFEVQSNKVMK